MKRSIFTLIIITLLAGCGSNTEAKKVTVKASKPTQQVSQDEKTMLFFLNPNGGPCKRQNKILAGMEDVLKTNHIKIQYVSTQNMDADGPIFQQYGIRALPTIIMLDNNGAEKKRFSPGVQSEAALLSAIN